MLAEILARLPDSRAELITAATAPMGPPSRVPPKIRATAPISSPVTERYQLETKGICWSGFTKSSKSAKLNSSPPQRSRFPAPGIRAAAPAK